MPTTAEYEHMPITVLGRASDYPHKHLQDLSASWGLRICVDYVIFSCFFLLFK